MKKEEYCYEAEEKAYQKPEMAFVDMEKHTVTGSPEMVSHVFKKIDQIVQELACENNIVQTIKDKGGCSNGICDGQAIT